MKRLGANGTVIPLAVFSMSTWLSEEPCQEYILLVEWLTA
jgi:hypothetical protein